MTDLPDPMTLPECDLRDFPYLPLDVIRLRDSDIAAVGDAEVFRCAVLAWCVSWHQIPAASLPDDDAAIARLIGMGRDVKGFRKLREAGALRGFVKCRDGRLYHPVVAEKAVTAWQSKNTQRNRTEKARTARLLQRVKSSVTDDVTQSKVREVKEREEKKTEASEPSPARDQGENMRCFEKTCQTLGYDPNDHKNWLEFIALLTRHSVKHETILAAAAALRASGRTGSGMAYLRPKALELRDAAAVLATAPVVFEPCDNQAWFNRWIAVHERRCLWQPSWGAPFGAPGCRIPEPVQVQIRRVLAKEAA